MDSLFPKCNQQIRIEPTDPKKEPKTKYCYGTLLPLISPPYTNHGIGILVWKCSECGRLISLRIGSI
jgi:hypothetical protein